LTFDVDDEDASAEADKDCAFLSAFRFWSTDSCCNGGGGETLSDTSLDEEALAEVGFRGGGDEVDKTAERGAALTSSDDSSEEPRTSTALSRAVAKGRDAGADFLEPRLPYVTGGFSRAFGGVSSSSRSSFSGSSGSGKK
jgi:hypothetical protein